MFDNSKTAYRFGDRESDMLKPGSHNVAVTALRFRPSRCALGQWPIASGQAMKDPQRLRNWQKGRTLQDVSIKAAVLLSLLIYGVR